MRVSVVAGLIVGVHVAVIGSVVMTQGCASTQRGAGSTEPAMVESAPAPVLPPSVAMVSQPVVQPVQFPVLQPPVEPTPLKTSVAAENVYVVKNGDSLSKIAAAHGVNSRELAELNQISDPNKVRIGQKLILPDHSKPSQSQPGEKSAAPAAKTEPAKTEEKPAEQPKVEEVKMDVPMEAAAVSAPVPVAVPVVEAAVEVAPAPEGAVAAPAPEGQEAMLDYTVQDGDTAEGIARLFVVRKDDILRVNNVPAGEDVKPGQKIKIPPSSL